MDRDRQRPVDLEQQRVDAVLRRARLRWRPHEDHSLFLRYAESFKAGGFDTGVTSIPGSIEDYRFEGESTLPPQAANASRWATSLTN